MDEMTKWLFEQLGMVVIMGIVIFWLQRRLIQLETERTTLTQDVIKLTTLWENKAKNLYEIDDANKKEIIRLLYEIKNLVQKQN